MEYPSRVIENAVAELSRLPGVGKKTALRLALHILRGSQTDAEGLGQAVIALRRDVQYCRECGNLSDHETCKICSSSRRDRSILCVVEDCKDVIALENTQQFTGLYHVLGGVIHPMQGVGPDQLNLESLFARLAQEEVRELIFALPSSIEGDTTSFYISRRINRPELRISSIARGIPVGSDLEFADEITLARSLMNRTEFRVQTETRSL